MRTGNPSQQLAAAVLPHFQRHAQKDGHAPAPDVRTVEQMIEAAFWASLRREEGYDPKTSLAYLRPEHTTKPLRFVHPFALDTDALTKVAPAVERPGIHLGVWQNGDGLEVWGTTRELPAFCFVVEVISPGVLVVKHSRPEEAGKYVNVAVLEGDRIKVLNERAATLPDCPNVVSQLFGLESSESRRELSNVLIQLATSMRAHERGGSLLVVPAGSEAWKESILKPLKYELSPPYAELTELVRSSEKDKQKRMWQDAIRRAVAMVAGLTAVDGATVINDHYEVLAFGAKITRRDPNPRVEQIISTEPIAGSEAEVVNPSLIGGTRHFSAAQFTQDQKDSLALVASQDGRFTVFAWSPCEDMVHAHRVEALLL
jgi:hypothetical protein